MSSITPYSLDNDTQTSLFNLLLDGNDSEESMSLKRVAPVGLAVGLLTVFTIVGNLLTIIAVLIEPKLHKFENYFFASLAVADLSIGVVVMPMQLRVEVNGGQWYSSNFACDLFIFTDVTCCTASILNLCAIGLNRYWSISSPLKYATKQTTTRAGITISVVWILSVIISSPPLFGWPTRVRQEYICMYDTDHYYVIYSSFGSFFIPLLLLSVVYYKIFRLAKQGARFRRAASSYNRPKRTSTSSNCYMIGRVSFGSDVSKNRVGRLGWGQKTWRKLYAGRQLSKADQAEMKTVKTLGVIMGTFVACWLPFFTLYLLVPFCVACKVPLGVDRFALWLGYTNSLLNPIIYICCKSLFRKTFKKIICLNYCRSKGRYRTSKNHRRGMYSNMIRKNCDGEDERLNEIHERKLDVIQDDDFTEGRIDTPSKNTASKLSCSPSSWSARKERLKQVTLNLVPQVKRFSSWRSKDSIENLEGRTIMTSFFTELDDSEPETYLSKSDSHLHRCGISNHAADGIIESELHSPSRLPRVRSVPNVSSDGMCQFNNLLVTPIDRSFLSVPEYASIFLGSNNDVGLRLSKDFQETVNQNDPHGIQVIVTDDTRDYASELEIIQDRNDQEMAQFINEVIPSTNRQCNLCRAGDDSSLACICTDNISSIETTLSKHHKEQPTRRTFDANNSGKLNKKNYNAIGQTIDKGLDSQHIFIDCSGSDSTTDSQISEEDFLRGKVKENICRRHIQSEDCTNCRRFVVIKEVGVQTVETQFNETSDSPYGNVRLEDEIPDLIASARLSEGLQHLSNSTRSYANETLCTVVLRKRGDNNNNNISSLRDGRHVERSAYREHVIEPDRPTRVQDSRAANMNALEKSSSSGGNEQGERSITNENAFYSRFDDTSLNVLVHCRSSDL